MQRISHPIHTWILRQDLVECADGREEDDGIDVVEETGPCVALITSTFGGVIESWIGLSYWDEGFDY